MRLGGAKLDMAAATQRDLNKRRSWSTKARRTKRSPLVEKVLGMQSPSKYSPRSRHQLMARSTTTRKENDQQAIFRITARRRTRCFGPRRAFHVIYQIAHCSCRTKNTRTRLATLDQLAKLTGRNRRGLAVKANAI